MNKIARGLAAAATAAVILGGTAVSTTQAATAAAPAAAPAAASAYPVVPTTYLRTTRQITFWTQVQTNVGGLSYTNTMWAGNLACAKKEQYHLVAQVGTVRARIADAIAGDVNRAYFGGRNYGAAKNIAAHAATDWWVNHCR